MTQCPCNHPLNNQAYGKPGNDMRFLSLNSIKGVPFILTQKGKKTRIAADNILSQLNGSYDIIIESYNIETVIRLVANDMGISLIPASFARTYYTGQQVNYYMNAPLYINDPELRQRLLAEPDIYRTLCKAREMTAFITGIGSKSSLPLTNPAFRPYLSVRDTESVQDCVGSIMGYVLDVKGQIADLDLNRKVMAIPSEELMTVAHRIAVAYGRHKVHAIRLAVNNGFINELITDTDTALMLLD